jgi:5-(carboxyamino)imidazole ribonucleotide mutase
MPGGVPVATFAVGSAGARNAAFFAAQVIAGQRPEVASALATWRRAGADKVAEGERQVQEELEREDG